MTTSIDGVSRHERNRALNSPISGGSGRHMKSFLLLLIMLCVLPAQAEVPVPPLKNRVTDLTRTLTPNQTDTLEQLLKSLEARKGSQVALLMLPTTRPETIEQYSMRVVEAWKLGRKGIDDGVLLLVAKDDRTLRIEVGYGLEGVMPDATANRIIDEIIAPFFKQGDFYGGLQAGLTRMVRVVEGEPLPPPAAGDPAWSGFGDYLPALFIGVLVVGSVLRALLGRLPGAGLAGGITGAVAMILVGSVLAAVIAALVVFVFVLASDGRGGRGGRISGSGGGSFGGGGGFSGGGGSFGGGGASGRW